MLNKNSINAIGPLSASLFAATCLVALFKSIYKPQSFSRIEVDGSANNDNHITYGLDISWQIHRQISANYPWLPHNIDPKNNPKPKLYEDTPIQPFGEDRHRAYMHHIEGCRKFYGPNSDQCDIYEFDRILMNKRQPQSMQVSTSMRYHTNKNEVFALTLSLMLFLTCLSFHSSLSRITLTLVS